MDLNTAKAIITGGASGLGFATAERVIAAGGQAVLLDINAEQGAASVARHSTAARIIVAQRFISIPFIPQSTRSSP